MNILYSETIDLFLKKVRQMVRHIMTHEMHLNVQKSRFLLGNYSYPIRLVTFEDKHKLGYFMPELLEIGIHRHFMLEKNRENLMNLLRHELGHYIAFIKYGRMISDHGREYIALCKSFGWGEDVFRAKSSIEIAQVDFTSNHILEKVQKLLALSKSSNKHESESALEKANHLLLKHSLETPDNSPTSYSVRVLYQKRVSAKLRVIQALLETFYVRALLNQGPGGVYLELFGLKHHVEVGEHVALYLNKELDRLFKLEANLKGISQKNAFMEGIKKGYLDKIRNFELSLNRLEKQALIKQQSSLDAVFERAFPNLKKSSYRMQFDQRAQDAGYKKGKDLTIARPVTEPEHKKSITYGSRS